MRADYAQIFRAESAAEKYEHVVYAPDSYGTAVNDRQRAYLRRLVVREFPQRRPVQHDFACGTGRAIRSLQGVVREAHGYDTSAAMLDKAREAGVQAKLHRVAEVGALPTPATTAGPALVTIFRLLLNVPEPVRDRAIAFAASVLPAADSGLLVVENHGNRSSLRHLGSDKHVGDPWFAELSHEQVSELLARHGFSIVRRRGFAHCPPGAYRRGWLRPIARRVDDLTARAGLLSGYATNVLYVARRTR
jgi:predicted TPR repeat methyltransferase